MCVSPKIVLNPAIKKMMEEKKLDQKSIKRIPPHSMVVLGKMPNGKLSLRKVNNTYDTGNGYGLQLYMSVDCGKCHECIKKRVNQLVARINIEMENHRNFGFFVTLTYDDLCLPLNECVDESTGEISYVQSVRKEDIQKFLKRLRINLSRKGYNIEDFKYFYVAEYGMSNTENKRPHYHIMVFFDGMAVNLFHDEVCRAWTLGNIKVEVLKQQGQMKYCAMSHCTASKFFPNPAGSDKPFSHWSQGFGLPKSKETKEYIRKNGLVKVDSFGYSADRFLQDKIYTKREKRKRTNSRLTMQDMESEEVKRYKKVVNRLFPNKSIEDLTFSEIVRVNNQLRSDESQNWKDFYKKYVLKKK